MVFGYGGLLTTDPATQDELDAAIGGLTGEGRAYYVSTDDSASDDNGGDGWANPLATIQEALDRCAAGDRIYVAPGEYDEAVTVPRAKSNVMLIGIGARGSSFIAPSAADSTALTVLADDFTIVNIGCDGDGTGHGLVNYGRRTRGYACKIEGGTDGLRLTLGTVAQIAALTHGKGDDSLWVDCEFAYNTNGVNLRCTDYGAVTQTRFRRCLFHDNTNDVVESVGSGGSAAVGFRDLDMSECKFRRDEAGAEPTAHLLLNADNANSGCVADCEFPTALAGGKNLVSTAVIWVANKHTGGISTGQPS